MHIYILVYSGILPTESRVDLFVNLMDRLIDARELRTQSHCYVCSVKVIEIFVMPPSWKILKRATTLSQIYPVVFHEK